MSQNLRVIAPLDWRVLVAEAIRRRKADKLTQRRHAALANVSIPTIVAFDRGERTLSLAKAFDILRVVGLVEERAEEGAQEVFVREAFVRWRKLTDDLPEGSPARFPHGWYRVDYALEGDLKEVEPGRLRKVLEGALTLPSDWRMFRIPTRNEIAPREIDGVLECWHSPDADRDRDLLVSKPNNCDFWRAAPTGRMILIRGYDEDSQEAFAPGKIFDAILPIRRLGEALLHAARLASLLKRDDGTAVTVTFRALYTGLAGRVLRAWADPFADRLVEGSAARSDEAVLEAVVPAAGIETNLAAYVFPLVASLYERFAVVGLSPNRVQAEIDRLLKSRIS